MLNGTQMSVGIPTHSPGKLGRRDADDVVGQSIQTKRAALDLRRACECALVPVGIADYGHRMMPGRVVSCEETRGPSRSARPWSRSSPMDTSPTRAGRWAALCAAGAGLDCVEMLNRLMVETDADVGEGVGALSQLLELRGGHFVVGVDENEAIGVG